MTLTRRRFFELAGAVIAAPVFPGGAAALGYPTQPVRVIVGLAPGGGVDIVARLMSEWLAERLGQPFVVENRPGGGTNIGTEFVARAAADGYTLLQIATPTAINASFYRNLRFNFIQDIAPIASIGRSPLVMVVNPSFPAATVADFIAYAKGNPRKINYASSGIGTPLHVAAELFKMEAGIDLVHVPYKGSAPALADLLGGQVQAMFADMSALPLIKGGKLRALAVTTAARSQVLPDVPVIADVVPGYEASAWQGMGAPRDTPPGIIATLNHAVNAALADSKVNTRLADLGFTPFASSPAQFAKFLADETEKWAKVVQEANIRLE
jgi:tripartite-type tricarboxylate transporter receptor subunit TctC